MPTRPNGGFIGTENVTDNASASGIYTLNEARELTEAGDFPPARYVPSKSLRFDGSSYLYKTIGAGGSTTTWTWSSWIKRTEQTNDPQRIFYTGNSSNNETDIYLTSGRLTIEYYVAPTNYYLVSTAKLRDSSAWYHIVVVLDTTNAISTERIRLYVNGSRLLNFDNISYPSTSGLTLNSNAVHYIGTRSDGSNKFTGYMSDVNFIDGQALPPTDFGYREAKTGMWVPKRYGGSYGTNGFFLSFANNSSTTTLGYDDGTGAIGAGAGSNDWTTSGFSVANDQNGDSFVDVPGIGSSVSVDTGGVVKSNYCTMNALQKAPSITVSNGGLYTSLGGGYYNWYGVLGTQAIRDYNVYFEARYAQNRTTSSCRIGVIDWDAETYKGPGQSDSYGGYFQNSYVHGTGDYVVYGTTTGASDGTTYTSSDVLMVAVNPTAGKVWFGKNGVWNNSSNPATDTGGYTIASYSGSVFPLASFNPDASTDAAEFNFGQRPFAHTPPAGFKSLCTTNIPDPEIVRPYEHFDIKTYTGRGTAVAIGNTAREPDNYQLPTSLRFDGSAYLQRNPTYKGNQKRWTWSGWVKRSKATTSNTLFGSYVDPNNFNIILLRETGDDGTLTLFNYSSGYDYQVRTKNVFIDDAEWYHIVVAYNSLDPAASDRVKIYVNGVLVEKTINNAITSGFPGDINSTYAHFIGNDGSNARYHDGYMSNVHFIDGAALTPDSFGTFDVDGSWQVKEYSPATPMNMPRTDYVAYFDGTGDYVRVLGTTEDFNFGSGDFTIECWVWPNNLPARHQMIMTKGAALTNNSFDWRLYYADTTVSSYQLWFECYIGGTQYGLPTNSNSAQHFKMNAWNHVVITRVGSVLRGYLNGEVVGQASITTGAIDNVYNTTYFGVGNVGAAGQTYFDGYAADLRVIKGTGTFTGVPNAKLTAVTNTKLLTFQDSTFIDNSTSAHTYVVAADAAMIRHGADYGINGFNLLNTVEDTEAAPTWNYNPMANFKTSNDGLFVNNQTYIYLTGAGYDGGYKGSTVSLGSFKALQNSWNMDYVANRNGVNSSPFPNYVIGLGRANTASSYSSGPTQSIWNMYISNNYNFDIYVQNANGTTLGSFNQGSSSWAYAGVAFRVSFDVSTYTYTFYGNTSGLFTGMTQIYTYTLTAPQIAAIQTYVNSDFYILGTYRANDDGWRNIRWYTV